VEMMRSRIVFCPRGHGPATFCRMPNGVQWVCDRCGPNVVVARAVLKKPEA